MLKPWGERDPEGITADVIMRRLNQRLAGLMEAQAFAFSPPAIPGVGTSGGITFMLEDRSGQSVEFLAQNTSKFLEVARTRPEFASLMTTFIPSVPQVFADVDHDKVMKQGVDLGAVSIGHSRRLWVACCELLQSLRTGVAGVCPSRR